MATVSTAFPPSPPLAPASAAGLINLLAQPLDGEGAAKVTAAADAPTAAQTAGAVASVAAAAKPFNKEAFAIKSFQAALDAVAEIEKLKPVKYEDLPVVDMAKRSLPSELQPNADAAPAAPGGIGTKELHLLPPYALISTDFKAGQAFARGTLALPTGEKVPFLAIRTYTWIVHYRGSAAHLCHTAYFHTNPTDKQQSYDLFGNFVEEPTTKLDGDQELMVTSTELDSENGVARHIAQRYKQDIKTIDHLVGDLRLGFQGSHTISHKLDTVGPHAPK